MERSDAELVAAACAGDLASFGTLYRRHYRLAVGIARSRLSDSHLAEDAAQEAFAVACRTLSTLKDQNRFTQWLGTICRRTATRLAECQSNHAPLTEDQEPVSDPALATLRLQVREALWTLDDDAREVVLLHYFSGLSHAEIAQTLDVSTDAVHGRLQRARRKLALVLDSPMQTGADE